MSDLFFTSPGAVSAAAAVDALLAYRNDDGGLGQALEPDLRAPTSHPLAVDFGLETAQRITEADAGTDHNVRRRLRGLADDCATWLSTVLTDEAGLPIVLPDAAAYARAAHWGDCRFDAGLNPTAGIVVRLRRFGVDAPWLAAAERFCVDRIEAMPADEMGISWRSWFRRRTVPGRCDNATDSPPIGTRSSPSICTPATVTV